MRHRLTSAVIYDAVFSGFTITVNSHNLTIGGNFTDNHSTTKNGNGTLTLTGNSTFTSSSGNLTVSAGTLVGVTGGSLILNGSALLTIGTEATHSVLVTSTGAQWTETYLTFGTGTPNLDFNFGYSAQPSSTAPLKATGTVTFTGTPSVTVEAGNLPAGTGTYALMTTGNTATGYPTTATLPPHVTGTLSYASKTLSLVVTANGQPLSWYPGSSGSTTWDVGTSTDWKNSGGTAGQTYLETTKPGDNVIFNDGGSGGTVTLNSTVTPASVTATNSTVNYTISGSGGIAGAAALTKGYAGTLTLATPNTYTGGTTLSAGVIQIGVDSVGSAGSITSSAVGTGTLALNGGTLSSDTTTSRTLYNAITFGNDVTLGDSTQNGALTLAGAGTLNGNRTLTIASAVTIRGAIGQDTAGRTLTLGASSAGTLTLSGANSYSGLTTVSAGELDLANTTGNAIAGSLTVGGGTVKLLHSDQINDSAAVTVSGGTLAMNGFNDTVGSVSLSSGSITGGGGTLTGTGFGVQSGTVSAILAGSGAALTKTTGATVTLSGANTYTGGTTVGGGTLLVNGGIGSSSAGTVEVQNTGTLGGTGTVTGALTVDNGGMIAPGTNSSTLFGALTSALTGGKTATFQTGATFTFELGSPGTSSTLAFTGLTGNQVTFNGNTINVVDAGGLAPGDYTLMTFDAASGYTGTLVASVPGYAGSYLTYNSQSIVLTVAAASAYSTVSLASTQNGAQEGLVHAIFTVSRPSDDPNLANAVVVNYAAAGSSTAVPGTDYIALSGSVTIPAASTSATIVVTPIWNANYTEGTGLGGYTTLGLNLSPSANYLLGSPTNATVNITNAAQPVVNFAATTDAAKEGLVNGVFNVTRVTTYGTGVVMNVSYTVSGTAQAGIDYNSLSGSVSIPISATNATIAVTPIWNTGWTNTTLALTLSSGAAYAIGSSNTATINIAPATEPVVSIVETANAAKDGPVNGLFTVSRPGGQGDTNLALTVNYTVSGTATAASDYTALPGSVTLAVGATSTNITVVPQQNYNFFPTPGTVLLTLSANALYAVGTPGSATVNITNSTIAVGPTNQFTALYTFSNSVAGNTTDPTPVPYVPAIQFGSFTMVGNGANAVAGQWYPNTWDPGTGLNAGQYLQVALTPTNGLGAGTYVRMSITNISFMVGAQNSGGTGPLSWAVRSSLDSYGANLTAWSSTNSNLTVSGGSDYITLGAAPSGEGTATNTGAWLVPGSGLGNLSSAVTLRIYGWPGTSDKDGGIDNFQVMGTWTINHLPVAQPIAMSAQSGSPTVVQIVGTTNVSDADGLPLIVSAVSPTVTNAFVTTDGTNVLYTYTNGVNTVFPATDTFGYTISDGVGGLATNTVTVTVSPSAPSWISIAATTNAQVAGLVNGAFTVSRDPTNASAMVTVNYSATGSTATAGTDYSVLSGSVTLGAGATNAIIPVNVLWNGDYTQAFETVVLTLSPSANTNYLVGSPSSGTVYITNGIEPTVSVQATANGAKTGPVNGAFTVSRDLLSASSGPVVVNYSVDGSATPNSDYAALPGSVTIPGNATSATITVVPLLQNYNWSTNPNTVSVTLLGSATHYLLGTPTSDIVYITNSAPPSTGMTNAFTALYTFSNTVVGSVTDPTPVPYVPGIQCGIFSLVGIGANSLAGAFYADSWNPANTPGGAQLTNNYLQVTFTPIAASGVGGAMTLTNISFDVARQTSGGYGPTNWAVRSSLDNFGANLATFTSTNANLTIVGGNTVAVASGVADHIFQSGASLALDSTFANLTSNVTFRIYGWAAGQNKDGGIDNFQVQGWWAVAPLPVITIDTTNQTVCAGSPVTWSVAVAGDNVTYQWQRRGTNLVENAGNFTGTTTTTLSNSGVTAADAVTATSGYTCLITTNGVFNVSVNSTKAALTVNPLPTVTVNSPTVCADALPTTITATPANGTAPYSYAWTVPSGATDPGNVASFSATVAGLYSVFVSDSKSCASASGSGTLTVKPTPATPTAGNNNPVYGAPLQLTASTVSGATYSWTGPNSFTSTAQNPTVSTHTTPAIAGTYYVIALVNGCSSAAGSTTVAVNQASTTNLVIASPNPSLPGAEVIISATPGAVPPGAGTPTGTVLFKTNGVPLCDPVALDTNGVATFITNSLPHGSTTVTAEFAGDSNFLGSTNSIVQIVNTPPTATNSTASVTEDTDLVLSIAKLLLKASDPDGDTLSITTAGPASTNGPTGNVALDTGAGTITYTPATDYVGSDSFTYTVSDNFGGTAIATVSVTVTPNNLVSPNVVAGPTYSDGTFRVTFAGIPNYQYTIQYAESPTGPWSYLKTVTAGPDGLFEVVDEPLPETPARFYRNVYP